MIERNYYLNRSAKDAYRSYLLAYASHSLKHIFNVNSLDLQNVSHGFGFTVPPRVNLNVSATGGTIFDQNSKPKYNSSSSNDNNDGGMDSDDDNGDQGAVKRRRSGSGFGDPSKRRMSDYNDPQRRKQAAIALQRSSGHGFSAHNPYGKRDSQDKRQFSH